MIDKVSTSQLFIDIVDYIDRKCDEQGIDNLFNLVEGTVRQQFLNEKVEEVDLNIFMYQIAFAVTMRYRAKKGV